MTSPLRLGTRGSQLALWQARSVASALEAAGQAIELVIIKTTGDKLQDAPLSESGGKRLFVKDLEDALLRHEIDVAVHSAKDLPAGLPDGLTITAALEREDPRDAIVVSKSHDASGLQPVLAALPTTARIGTGSVRRIAQLRALVPAADFVAVRGNVDTRLRKLDVGEFDALVLACAGLRRLNQASRISAALSIDHCVPAPGQGIVVAESRGDDAPIRRWMQAIRHEPSHIALSAERALVEALGGDCQIPLGAIARLDGAGLDMSAVVCSLDGQHVVRRSARGPAGYPERLGQRLASELINAGAKEILDEARRAPTAGTGHTEGA
jgi:hydroxymethylbilane synthase